MTTEPSTHRQALGWFLSSVTLVSSRAGGDDHLATVSSFSVASFKAARVSISLGSHSRLTRMIRSTGVWGVSLLGTDAGELARFFAAPGREHGAGLGQTSYHRGPRTGVVLLDDALATLECRNLAELDGGSHVIFLAEPIWSSAKAASTTRTPLCHFRGGLCRPVLEPAADRPPATDALVQPPVPDTPVQVTLDHLESVDGEGRLLQHPRERAREPVAAGRIAARGRGGGGYLLRGERAPAARRGQRRCLPGVLAGA